MTPSMRVGAESEKTLLPNRCETRLAIEAPSLHPSVPSPRTQMSRTWGRGDEPARAVRAPVRASASTNANESRSTCGSTFPRRHRKKRTDRKDAKSGRGGVPPCAGRVSACHRAVQLLAHPQPLRPALLAARQRLTDGQADGAGQV